MIETASLLAQARAATGLADFGDEWFLVPLEKLVASINAEAGLLHDGGHIDRIVYALMDRLVVTDLIRRRPEILDEEINVAAAIIGLPRTGSTMLHRLLASLPGMTSPWWWEVTFPLPLPGEEPGDPSPAPRAGEADGAGFPCRLAEFRKHRPDRRDGSRRRGHPARQELPVDDL